MKKIEDDNKELNKLLNNIVDIYYLAMKKGEVIGYQRALEDFKKIRIDK